MNRKMNIEAADRARDAKLRWQILKALEAVRSIPWNPALRIQRIIDGADDTDKFTDADHCLSLLMDLSDDGYIQIDDLRTRRDEPYALETLNLRITAKGVRFLMGGEPADPMIDDGRIPRRG